MELTQQQAIEQGYTHFGLYDEGYQHMRDIKYFNTDSYPLTGNECLFEKESISPVVGAENIRELIAEDTECNWDSETSDDTNEVMNTIMDMPLDLFETLAAEINNQLQKKSYYRLSEIKLIP